MGTAGAVGRGHTAPTSPGRTFGTNTQNLTLPQAQTRDKGWAAAWPSFRVLLRNPACLGKNSTVPPVPPVDTSVLPEAWGHMSSDSPTAQQRREPHYLPGSCCWEYSTGYAGAERGKEGAHEGPSSEPARVPILLLGGGSGSALVRGRRKGRPVPSPAPPGPAVWRPATIGPYSPQRDRQRPV